MMRFRQFIIEAAATVAKKASSSKKKNEVVDKHVAITFGRFNPPHAGHGKLMDAVKSHAGDSGNYRIYPSRTQDHKKNPLHPEQKIEHMRGMFKGHKDAIQNSEQHRNIFDILRDLHDEGHEHVTMVVGDDRVKEFENLTQKYNGKHYDFKSINIKSAGARNPDSEDEVEKLSASAMRKHAQGGDHDSFHKGSGGYKKSKELMQHVMDGMKPPEKKKSAAKKKATVKESIWEYAPMLDFDTFRDHYMLDHIFKVGAIVEHDDSGMRGTIAHRGTNYVIMQMPDGTEHRTWLQDISEVHNDQSNYSADDGSGNDWKVGTDKYRQAVQNMTPGQEMKKFSEFVKNQKSVKNK